MAACEGVRRNAFSKWTTTRSSTASARACARSCPKDVGRRGFVVAMSGGIDSSVSSALCVKALGTERVYGLMLPERDSSGIQHRARPAARRASRHHVRGVRHRAGARRHRLLPLARRGHPPRVPGIRRRLEEQDRDQRAASKAASTTSSWWCRRRPARLKTGAPAAAGIPADRRRDQLQAAHPQDGRVLPRRPAQLRGHRHAEPARVRPGLLREERRRQRRREADRAPVQDAGVRARAPPEAARRRSAPPCRPPTPTAWRRARTSSISRCRTRRWISRCGRSTTATRAAELAAALGITRDAGGERVPRHRGQAPRDALHAPEAGAGRSRCRSSSL